ncbi:hypothetical protein THRCLA_20215 [Thraustotheca clavata]|uniref:Uncharacterized protein n=1 Tax=Thraustotheca clavata TaxID=74557 RepID=A0A1W0AA39_9STRA|nr:hypothetical protein THRCLA_20215 [Thraustotheca clavata]
MNVAAENGQLEMIQYMHTSGSKACSSEAVDLAARNGHLNITKWLHENGKEGCTIRAVHNSIISDNVIILKYLINQGHVECSEFDMVNCTTKVMDNAAAISDLETVKYLHEHRTEGYRTKAMDMAAERGDFEMVKFLHLNHTGGCTANAMDNAAKFGHFSVKGVLRVQWIMLQRMGIMKLLNIFITAMDYAAWKGHFDIVRFIHEIRTEGCSTQFSMEGPLTQYFNAALVQPSQAMIKNIWGDVFQLDWTGDIESFPKLTINLPTTPNDEHYPYRLIQSRIMYFL